MEIKLTEADNNKSIKAHKSDKVIITLAWKPTTGYFWQESDTTAATLEQIKHDGESDVPGAPAIVTFIFRIIKAGFITLACARPWDGGKPPAKWFHVDVDLQS